MMQTRKKTTTTEGRIVRPDAKGRISLGVLPPHISGFKLTTDKNGCYILEPLTEIPERERWVYENPEVLASLERGIEDARAGRLIKLDPSRFLINEEEDDE